MSNIIKKIGAGATMLFLFGSLVTVGAGSADLVYAQDLGVDYPAASGLSKVDIRVTVAKTIRVALSVVGIIFVALVMYGGFLYMTAGGNDEQIGTAKKWIIGPTIGLAIMLMAYGITSYVITQLTNVTTSGEANVPLNTGVNIPGE